MKLAMTRQQQITALLADFQTQYPVLIDLDNPKPLKIGIFQDLCARHPEQDRGLIRHSLWLYTHRDRYLKALVDVGKRYDLDGHAVGEVTPEQHDAALTELTHRAEQARRQKARKKAERKAARQAAAASSLDTAPPPPPSPPPVVSVPHPSSTPPPLRRPIISLKKTAGPETVAKALDCDTYFAKPYHSWERGQNENANGLLRQYFPKAMELVGVTTQQVMEAVHKLNSRPRKCLDFRTPYEMFEQLTGIKVDKLTGYALMT